MNLTSEHPHAVYIAGLLAEREDGLLYGNLEDEFLCFVEKDNAQTREVLSYLGYLLFFYKNRDESGRCVLDLSNHRDAIFGDSGLVAAFRIYCMLENFTRKGWIQSEVAEYPVLETLDRRGSDGKTGASRLLSRALDAGFHTVVDLVSVHMGNFREVVLPSLPVIDTLFLNELEAGALLDRSLREDDSAGLMAAAAAVLELGVRCRAIVHSACGAVVAASDGKSAKHGSLRLPSSEVKGAAGAGDAFAAGVLLGLHQGRNLEECLSFGACSAAGCLTHPTTSGGVKTLELSLELGKEFGFRDFT